MKYQAYPKYKSSGIEWLGDVPEHWNVKRLRFVAEYKNSNVDKKSYEDQKDVRLCNYTDVYYNEFINNDMDFMVATASDAEIKSMSLKRGDVIITKDSEDPRDIGIPAIVVEDLDNVVCGYHLTVISSVNINTNRFVHRVIQSEISKYYFLVMSPGMTRYGLNQNSIGNTIIPLPTTHEQKAIANFLDIETRRIDNLIQEKKYFIELLNEKRQALITHAVTKGLDPNARLKSSEIEWFGEVPEHWKVVSIKHLVSTPVTDGPHETPDFVDDGIPFISAEACSSGKINFDKIRGFISKEDHLKYSKKYYPKKFDIFLIKSGATTGVSAIVDTDKDFNIWSPLAVIRCSKKYNPYFVLNAIRSKSFQVGIALNWSFGTQQNIGMGVIENLRLPMPSYDEQLEIVKFLDRETSKIDNIIKETSNSIDLLKEHRTALISAAVTGKIDVRHLAKEAA